ncbi:MAG: hypothetical protein JNL72_10535 [Flavipsychrobacter sp.]|nr:hypothetical protein [Flavipsychrobacter sp.]
MRKSIAIIVSLCLLLQCAAQLGIIGMYRLNKDYIARNLCENRNKPKLKCNGKCQLNKQLKKANEQQEKESKQQQEEVALFTACVLPEVWALRSWPADAALPHNCHYTAPGGISFSADIFHPPQA